MTTLNDDVKNNYEVNVLTSSYVWWSAVDSLESFNANNVKANPEDESTQQNASLNQEASI